MSALTLDIGLPLSLGTDWYVVAAPPESGAVHSRGTGHSNQSTKRWTVGIETAYATERDEIVTLYQEVRGGASTFTWTPPGGVEGTYRFTEEFTVQQTGTGTHNFTAQIEEVRTQ